MAYSRPTLAEIVARVESDMSTRLGTSSPVLPKSVARIVARVIAGAVHMVYGFVDYMVDQIFTSTANRENLVRKGAETGLPLNAATYATGNVTFTGTNGTAVPTGSRVSRADGAVYEVTTGGTVSGTTVTLPAQATVAGVDGQCAAGTALSLTSPIAGITTAVVASGGMTGGADEEDTEDYRARLLEAQQAESLGGSDDDYVTWAKSVAGVTRAWVSRHEEGLGTVTVRFVRDGDVSIFPDPAEVLAVQAVLDAERPTTAEVFVVAPTAGTVAFTLSISPDTPELRAAVEAEMTDLFYRNGEPGGTVLLSEMRTAIGVVSPSYTLTTPSADYVAATGAIPTVGTFTWI